VTNAAVAANKAARGTVGLLTQDMVHERDALAEENAQMPPKPMKRITLQELLQDGGLPDVYDEASDPVATRRKQVAQRRKQLLGLTPDEAEELVAMPPMPMKKHRCGKDVHDEANDPVAERRKELNAMQFEAQCMLDEELANAVQASDLAAAEVAFAKGASLDLLYVGGEHDYFDEILISSSLPPRDDDAHIQGELVGVYAKINARLEDTGGWRGGGWGSDSALTFLTNDVFLSQHYDGEVGVFGQGSGEFVCDCSHKANDLVPLICLVANNLPVVSWLLDHGANVNATQPKIDPGADDGNIQRYGGANVLCFAKTPEAVELLCARGADVDCMWAPGPYGTHASDPVATDRGLLTSKSRDGPVARCLVRHGADVNAIYESGDFGSYWMNVVQSGDAAWAAELLAKYGANANWPLKRDVRGQEDEFEEVDMSTVLAVAVRKQNLPMARLLLEHGADVNKTKSLDNLGYEVGCDENEEVKTLLSMALETGNAAIIELLKSKGAKGE
jgi:ankyrin repeat protein